MSRKFFLTKKMANNYLVKYFLLEEKSRENNISLYGIELELYQVDKKFKTRESIRKITNSKQIILHMIKIMAQKNVTPVSLLYVVDEIFDMASKKFNLNHVKFY